MSTTQYHAAPFWNRHADRYAASPVANEAAYQRKLQITRDYLSPNTRVLELGCGTGSTAIALSPDAWQILATDVSPRMIEIASDKAAKHGVDNVTFQCCAAADVNVPDASQDVVLVHSLLHLLDDWQTVLQRAHRQLKPGGVLISSTVCMRDDFGWMRPLASLGRRLGLLPLMSFFTQDDLEQGLKAAGFSIEERWQPTPRRGWFHVAKALS